MFAEEHKAIVRRYYDDLWNKWDLALVEELIAPDITFRGSLAVTVSGLDGFKRYVNLVRGAFPDFHNTLEDLIAEGDRVVARLTYRGTHRGELFGVAPTGKAVAYAGVAIFRLAGGRIVDGWVLGDTMGLMRQLGALPPMSQNPSALCQAAKRQPPHPYIPALRYGWLASLYDPLLRWTMRESIFKRHLVEQARIAEGQRVLDLGCGTATLTLMIKQAHPKAVVVGLDGDPRILDIARAKVAKAGLDVTLDQAMAFELPYPDESFDRVLSSLLFNHLTTENKRRTLREVFRILRPGGELHVVDWGKAQNRLMRIAFLAVQILDGFQTTMDNVKGLLPELFHAAGFEGVQESARHLTIFSTLSLYQARKPG